MNSNFVNIKGTREGLVIIFDHNQEFELIKKHLLLKMESAKGFFKGAKFVVYDRDTISNNQRRELEAICCNYGLIPSELTATKTPEKQTVDNKPKDEGNLGEGVLMVRNNLRGGQRIVHEKNVVVLGNVHPGAEIFAGKSIIIMGSCKGNIHAGTGGDEYAKVIALRLAPAIISIAGVLARSTQKNKTPNSYPEVAFLEKGKIIINRYL